MTKTQLETLAVDKFESYLNSEFGSEIEVIGTRLALWKTDLSKTLPNQPLQPDIDILWKRPDSPGALYGAEIKTIRIDQRFRITSPYYRGVDEALALLRLGLDSASLIHVFLFTTEMESNNRLAEKFIPYQRGIIDFIDTLRLPIGYRAVYGFVEKRRLTPHPFQVLQVGQSDMFFREPGKNPFLSDFKNIQRIHTFLRSYVADR